jgi:hypothetical protein
MAHDCPKASKGLTLSRSRNDGESAKSGLPGSSETRNPRQGGKQVGDGVALKSMAHPPGAIEKMAEAIRSGKLNAKRGRPKVEGQRPWEAARISRAEWYRRKAESKPK